MSGFVRHEADRLVGVGVVELFQEGQEFGSSVAALHAAGEVAGRDLKGCHAVVTPCRLP